ncbi:hypothetical protein PInf_007122 [Phytophthora infestans]|nr:hypothetical protein PInf_007122 [Phytophthora infestans]
MDGVRPNGIGTVVKHQPLGRKQETFARLIVPFAAETPSEPKKSMARKNYEHSVVVSDKCFRLLRLKHEMQSDVKVLKAVVDEVDVLRLCRLLGMATSDEDKPVSKHNFEFGMFNSSDYDVDFARFIREKLATGTARGEERGDED